MYRANQDDGWSCLSSEVITPSAVTHVRSGKVNPAENFRTDWGEAPEVSPLAKELLTAAGRGNVTFLSFFFLKKYIFK